MIIYRPLSIQDWDKLSRLWRNTEGILLRPGEDSAEGIARILAHNPRTCLSAWEGEALVGAALVTTDQKRGYVYHLAVASTHRGQGIAQTLLRQAAQVLKEQGIPKLSFVVLRNNHSGNAFWEHIGATRRDDLYYYDLDID